MAQLKLTPDILSAALEGYEAEKERIDARIAEWARYTGIPPCQATD
jgi:hypothetical protein